MRRRLRAPFPATGLLLATAVLAAGCPSESGDDDASVADDDVAGDDDTAADPCSDYVGLVTPEEVAATPRDERDAEAIALCLTGGLIARQDVYDRVMADIDAIYAGDDSVVGMEVYHHYSGELMDFGVDDETFAQMKAGEYTAWDCANAYYGVERVTYLETLTFGTIEFKGYYNLGLLGEEYRALPGIVSTGPRTDYSDGPRIRGVIDGSTYHYVFDNRWGDCIDGCYYGEGRYYISSAPGTFELIDAFEWGYEPYTPPPDWFETHNVCLYDY